MPRRSTRDVPFELLPLETRTLLSSLATIAIFNSTDGATPESSVILDSAGNVYGTTAFGGANGEGVVYELPNSYSAIGVLASMNLPGGEFPVSDLTMDSAGNLFGADSQGGASLDGTVFEIPANSNASMLVATFNGNNGHTPGGPLIVDSSGNLFGEVESGGANGDGAIFEVATGGTLRDLFSFNVNDGQDPSGGLIVDTAGNIFGVTNEGGAQGDGTVFEIPTGTNTVETVASFNVFNGQNPQSRLAIDSAGNLFGTTSAGGSDGEGDVFEIAAGTNTISVLASFNIGNGQTPTGDIAIDASDDVFGTTQAGGADGKGTVFEVPDGSNAVTTLYNFTAESDGATPIGGVTLDASGNLFGTTSAAAAGFGTIFEIPGVAFASVNTSGQLTIDGTPGNDTITVSDNGGAITVTLNGQTSQTMPNVASILVDAGAGNDSVDLSAANVPATISGGAGADTLVGTSANCSINGGAGDDSLQGGAGNDTIVGGGGNDFIKGGAGDDSLFGGPGNDTIHGGQGDDTLVGGVGSDILSGNAGNNSLVAGQGPDYLKAGLGRDTLIGSINPGDLPDTLVASTGGDFLDAGPNDVIVNDDQ